MERGPQKCCWELGCTRFCEQTRSLLPYLKRAPEDRLYRSDITLRLIFSYNQIKILGISILSEYIPFPQYKLLSENPRAKTWLSPAFSHAAGGLRPRQAGRRLLAHEA